LSCRRRPTGEKAEAERQARLESQRRLERRRLAEEPEY
jgi:hypothetical protein